MQKIYVYNQLNTNSNWPLSSKNKVKPQPAQVDDDNTFLTLLNDDNCKTFTALTEQNGLVTDEAEAPQFTISENLTQSDVIFSQ